MAELISASIDLAHHAGARIKQIYESGQLGAVDKSNPSAAPTDSNPATASAPFGSIDDPQTLADLASQRIILGSLQHTFPGLRLVGEEGDIPISPADLVAPKLSLVEAGRFPEQLRRVELERVTVYIDPLDGTKEFTLGHTEGVTLLIGFTIDDRAVAGVIGQPFTGNVVWGAVGVGVEGVQQHTVRNYHDEDPASSMLDTATPPAPLPASAPHSRVIVTTRSHFTPLLSQLLTRLQPTRLVRSGGAGSKTLLLVSHQVDCYYFPSPGLKVEHTHSHRTHCDARRSDLSSVWLRRLALTCLPAVCTATPLSLCCPVVGRGSLPGRGGGGRWQGDGRVGRRAAVGREQGQGGRLCCARRYDRHAEATRLLCGAAGHGHCGRGQWSRPGQDIVRLHTACNTQHALQLSRPALRLTVPAPRACLCSAGGVRRASPAQCAPARWPRPQ